MRLFLDTNVLISALIDEHGEHTRAFPILERVQNKADEGVISGHSIAEIYAVLTKAPPPLRRSPEQALLTIEENVLKYFKIFVLSGPEYAALIREAAFVGVQGGTIHDAVLLKCADKSEADRIYTLNLKHFERIAPRTIAAKITEP